MKSHWLALALALTLAPFSAKADSALDAHGIESLPEGEVELTDVMSPEEIYSEMLQQGMSRENDYLDIDANPTAAQPAKVYVLVSKAQQHLWVFQDNQLIPGWDWPVSTATETRYCDGTGGRCGFAHTPTGVRHPGALDWTHYSRAFNNAAMHRAIQFGPTGGIFLHATYGNHIAHLGKRASHGCIRQAPQNAETLFNLVKSVVNNPAYGRGAVYIEITEAAVMNPATYLRQPARALAN